MINEDDDLQNGLADDDLPAGSETSEAKAKGKPDADAKTETDEDGAEGEQPEGAGEGEEEDKPKKRRSGVDRLKRERDALRTEVEILRSRAPAANDSAAIEAVVLNKIGDAPKEADYQDWFAYERALNAYETDKRIVTREVKGQAEQAASQTNARVQDLIEDFNERCTEAAAKIPDFAEVVGKTTDRTHPVSPVVGQLILESEKGPLLQYHFAKNADDLRRINALPPLAAAREIGKIEARLSLAKPTTSTKAPPPVAAPKGGAAPSSQEARMEAYLQKQYGKRA